MHSIGRCFTFATYWFAIIIPCPRNTSSSLRVYSWISAPPFAIECSGDTKEEPTAYYAHMHMSIIPRKGAVTIKYGVRIRLSDCPTQCCVFYCKLRHGRDGLSRSGYVDYRTPNVASWVEWLGVRSEVWRQAWDERPRSNSTCVYTSRLEIPAAYPCISWTNHTHAASISPAACIRQQRQMRRGQ